MMLEAGMRLRRKTYTWLLLLGRCYSRHILELVLSLVHRGALDPCVLCGIGKCSLGMRLTVARKGMGKAASSDLRPP